MRFLEETSIAGTKAYPVIKSYHKFAKRKPAKRALLSYLTAPVLADMRGEKIVRFSNHGLAITWVRVLNELGYELDIIDWDNIEFDPTHSYDLVVLHGAKNEKNLLPKLKHKAVVIHFLTGSYWRYNNAQEDQRRSDFKNRHGVLVARDRFIETSEDTVNEAAKGIIVLGNKSMRETYPASYPIIKTMNNASYPDDHFKSVPKNYAEARGNFLFFAGSGNVHKGLDLVIESFAGLKENLYVVTVLDKEVMDVFAKQLKRPNIHLIGDVNMRTSEFYEIMDTCAFSILPSCSEGQAGSMIECMNQGLIPIVSKETRLDPGKNGVVLKDNTIATIRETVTSLSALSKYNVAKRSKAVHKLAQKKHSPDYVRKQLKRAVRSILSA